MTHPQNSPARAEQRELQKGKLAGDSCMTIEWYCCFDIKSWSDQELAGALSDALAQCKGKRLAHAQ